MREQQVFAVFWVRDDGAQAVVVAVEGMRSDLIWNVFKRKSAYALIWMMRERNWRMK